MKLAKLEQKITVFFLSTSIFLKSFEQVDVFFFFSFQWKVNSNLSRVGFIIFHSPARHFGVESLILLLDSLQQITPNIGKVPSVFQIEYCQKCFFVSPRSLIIPLDISSIGTDSAKYLKALAFFSFMRMCSS